jgi:cysteine-S-conjugate beta-lyase
MKRDTRLIHGGRDRAQGELARTVGPPIQRGSTVLLPDAAAMADYSRISYGRQGLAVHEALQDALAEMEGAVRVSLFPSGVAAISGALLAVLSAGDEVLMVDTVYRPSRRFADSVLKRFGITTRYYGADLSAEAVMALCTPATRLILMESPGSLTMEMQDVSAIAAAANARGIMTAIDNTWAAGLLFKPLEHGVTLSLQSLTKYVGGHSDVFMGSVATADPAIARMLDAAQLEVGWAVSPDDAFAMLRGLRTLGTRLDRHGKTGLALAAWLRNRPEVAQVLHPALPGAPGNDLWKRDFSGACGLFSFVLNPGAPKAVDAFLDALELFGLGYSWGGFESLAIPCDPQFACRLNPPKFAGPVIRLHAGLEDAGDLMGDLDRALAAACKG